jgi:hypothetical protein
LRRIVTRHHCMYCFVCLEVNTARSHVCPSGCPLFCSDLCDCVPCRLPPPPTPPTRYPTLPPALPPPLPHSECVSARGCSQCDNSGDGGCPTCASESPAAAAARLARSNAAQLLKRARGWCGPRIHNPAAQACARRAFVPVAAAPAPPVVNIESTVIAHMLQRLQHPLLHHCEASAIMRQLSQWLNTFWAHSSDPAGLRHAAPLCCSKLPVCNKRQLSVSWASTPLRWA